jgi:hypothetical protein
MKEEHPIKHEIRLANGHISTSEYSLKEIDEMREDLAEREWDYLKDKPRKRILKVLKESIWKGWKNMPDREILKWNENYDGSCMAMSDTSGQWEVVEGHI